MAEIIEQARNIPIIDDVDICVLGGSATGVSAAVRAARLGAKVAIVEQLNCFGGCATAGMVCIWHSLYDTTFKRQIIGGMTAEILERLKRRPYALDVEPHDPDKPFRMASIMNYRLNTEELKIELDELITEAGIRPYLHTFYAAPYVEDGELKAVFVENKSGRGAIKARFFIDATADGDLCVHLGLPSYKHDELQPATTSSRVYRWDDVADANKILLEHTEEMGYSNIGWNTYIPGAPEVSFLAKTNVNCDCSDANELTKAEIEGRRQMRSLMDVLRKYAKNGDKPVLLALSSRIGARETRQVGCRYKLTFEDIVYGKRFSDAIANCAYPPDIHHAGAGATYWYLDGVKEFTTHTGRPNEFTRWREKTDQDPTFWQIPYGSLVPGKYDNVLVCGRAVDADKGAFAAIRVMVSMNQTGEAAGVAAYEALTGGKGVGEIDTAVLRAKLKQGGSIVF